MLQCVAVAESSWLALSVLPTQCRTDSVPVYVEKSADAILSTSGVEEDRWDKYFNKTCKKFIIYFSEEKLKKG